MTAGERTRRARAGTGAIRPFDRSLPMALLRAREAVMGRFRPLLRSHDVTEQQWRVLRALAETDETSAGELSKATCISMPSLSRILKSLVSRRLARRRVRPADLRTTWLSITARGRTLVSEVGAESEAIYRAIEIDLGRDRLEDLYHRLDEVVVRLGGP